MKFLLSVIALCLVMITAKLYIPQAHAAVDGKTRYDLYRDSEFNSAVRTVIVNHCSSRSTPQYKTATRIKCEHNFNDRNGYEK